MAKKDDLVIHWFRRDLRYKDNAALTQALNHALTSGFKVLPIFIFDPHILSKLRKPTDLRVQFILDTLLGLEGMQIHYGNPVDVFQKLIQKFNVQCVYTNEDYEPEAIKRDSDVEELLKSKGVGFKSSKDQVIFAPSEVLKADGTPYLVFTPYSRKWKECFKALKLAPHESEKILAKNPELLMRRAPTKISQLSDIGFKRSDFEFPGTSISKNTLKKYEEHRNFPALKQGTTHLGLHLRFGTVSVRHAVKVADENSAVWLSELIWREFFMMILYHFPFTVEEPFKEKYKNIEWRNDVADFERWKEGQTGYPIVDAGMRELKATGFMHNRVRMITASFLTKHLMIHWKLGERHFAELLLDYDLSANVGNWQWTAGCGVDAAPYFRIFNPHSQQQKFDLKKEYINKWVPELGSDKYPEPMVDHEFARRRALRTFKEGLEK